MKMAERVFNACASAITILNAGLSLIGWAILKPLNNQTETATAIYTMVSNFALPTRAVAIFILEGALAHFFGLIFKRISIFEHKATAVLFAVMIALVSAWISFFNIELFLTGPYQFALDIDRYVALGVLGIIFCFVASCFAGMHLSDVSAWEDIFDFDNWKIGNWFVFIQVLSFIIIFFAIVFQ